MTDAKPAARRPGADASARAEARAQGAGQFVQWREGLMEVTSMISAGDLETLRAFCQQLTASPDAAIALHGILQFAENGRIQTWNGIPDELVRIAADTAEQLSLMDEQLTDGEIGEPGLGEAGCWMQVSLTEDGTTRIIAGWFDLDDDPETVDFLPYINGEFDTTEAVLVYLLIAEMADFAIYTGYEARLN